MKKSLVSLAMGTLALGITEYVMMAILPNVSESLHVSIPAAGHLISSYAIGVSVGAPLLVFAHQYKPKSILLTLTGLMVLGALISIFSPNYWVLLAARFISGLPHGAYFGVASIVAVRLADKGHEAGAVAVMIAGMTFANLLGVPLATALASSLSWRFPFVLAMLCALLVLFFIWRWVPDLDATPCESFRKQFVFLRRPAPWLILAATMLGNGGVFCWYSYVAPVLTQESGFSPDALFTLMIAAGLGMVLGNMLSGKFADRFKPARFATYVQITIAISLIGIFFLCHQPSLSVALMMVCAACLFAVSGPEQFLILKHAPGGEMLGGACVQMAFNLGNALGAFLGGVPISLGLSPRYSTLPGIPLALIGFVCLLMLYRKYERPSAAQHEGR